MGRLIESRKKRIIVAVNSNHVFIVRNDGRNRERKTSQVQYLSKGDMDKSLQGNGDEYEIVKIKKLYTSVDDGHASR